MKFSVDPYLSQIVVVCLPKSNPAVARLPENTSVVSPASRRPVTSRLRL